jgi:hypothetical protein
MEPFVETINLRVIPATTSVYAEFMAGKLDLIGLSGLPVERKNMQTDPRFNVYSDIASNRYTNF